MGALVVSAIFYWQFGYVRPRNGTHASWWFDLLFTGGSWFWILTFIGFAIQHLTLEGPFLRYANEAVLPFYIMHQTVLLFFGFYILSWQIPDIVKWLLIAIISLIFILGLYELAVRRFKILRFLFGMKVFSNGTKQNAFELKRSAGSLELPVNSVLEPAREGSALDTGHKLKR